MKKVMMIVYRIYPQNAGDSLYNYGLAKEIAEIIPLTVFSYIDNGVEEIRNTLLDNSKVIANLYHNHGDYSLLKNVLAKIGSVASVDKAMLNTIRNELKTGAYRHVIISHIVMAQYALILKKDFPDIDFIYVSHDAETFNQELRDKFESRQKNRKPLKRFFHSIRNYVELSVHKNYERWLLNCGKHYFTISKADAEIHKDMFTAVAEPIFSKPLIDFPCCKASRNLEEFHKVIVLAGTMCWFPNVEGALWFCENVMKKLMQEEYTLYLVGNQPTESILQLAKENPGKIIVTGRVESMDTYFEMADISVVPLFSGTGAKIKVLESIARGIPTVCTTYAAKDYDINDEILIADTPEEFIEAIHKIESSAELRKKLLKKEQLYYKNYMKLNPEIIDLLSDGENTI